MPDLTAELHRVKREPAATSSTERWLQRAMPVATHVSGALPAMYAVLARSVALWQRSDTVAVSTAGMFGGGWDSGSRPLDLFTLAVVVPEPDGGCFLVEEPAAAAT